MFAQTKSFAARQLKPFLSNHIRQVPCLHAAWTWIASKAPSVCKRSGRYSTLGQEEGGDGTEVEDRRQDVNFYFGQAMVRLASALMVILVVKLLYDTYQSEPIWPDDEVEYNASKPVSIWEDPHEHAKNAGQKLDEFRQTAPLVLFVGIMQILVCGACAHTAASMYTRRRHALVHPKDAPEAVQTYYIKVHLEKETGREDEQLYGLNYRTSTDGLECLIVEAVRPGSLLWRWNRDARRPSPQELVERALGDEAEEGDMPPAQPAESSSERYRVPPQVNPGAAIVAINGVSADVGLMQQQLAQPKVTLWVRPDLGYHASDFQGLVFDDVEGTTQPDIGEGPRPPDVEAPPAKGGKADPDAPDGQADLDPTAPQPFGRVDNTYVNELRRAADAASEASAPRVACLALEDEEPQILMRWTACSLLFGWVTMLPVLLMHPHEERPRQQLFRQFLLKPSLLVLFPWMLLWFVDSLEIIFATPILPPFAYFSFCHMVLPTILLKFLCNMQVEDERLILEQRKTRGAEAAGAMPFCCEDPPPTFFKELLVMNPVSMALVGANLAVQIVLAAVFMPLQTRRGQLAAKHLKMVYAPLILLQLEYLRLLSKTSFMDLPQAYADAFTTMLTLPCLVMWCTCFLCAARYGKHDMAMVYTQREERAQEALKKIEVPGGTTAAAAVEEGGGNANNTRPNVDCTEAHSREWELTFSA